MKGFLIFIAKLVLVPIVVAVSGAVILQIIGLSTGNPDLLVETIAKVDTLLDKLISLADECAERCFNE